MTDNVEPNANAAKPAEAFHERAIQAIAPLFARAVHATADPTERETWTRRFVVGLAVLRVLAGIGSPHENSTIDRTWGILQGADGEGAVILRLSRLVEGLAGAAEGAALLRAELALTWPGVEDRVSESLLGRLLEQHRSREKKTSGVIADVMIQGHIDGAERDPVATLKRVSETLRRAKHKP